MTTSAVEQSSREALLTIRAFEEAEINLPVSTAEIDVERERFTILGCPLSDEDYVRMVRKKRALLKWAQYRLAALPPIYLNLADRSEPTERRPV
jgi:hypothetical protein